MLFWFIFPFAFIFVARFANKILLIVLPQSRSLFAQRVTQLSIAGIKKTDFQITWQKPRLEAGVIKPTVKTLSGSRQ